MTMMDGNFMELDHDLSRDETAFGRALANLLRDRYPVHTAGRIAQDMRWTKKASENLLAGHLSARTITRLIRVYGMGLVIAATEAVIGHTLRDFIHQQAEAAREEQARAREIEADHVDKLAALDAVSAELPGGLRSDP